MTLLDNIFDWSNSIPSASIPILFSSSTNTPSPAPMSRHDFMESNLQCFLRYDM